MKLFLEIFISFFKVGLFTFGGGYAMLPMFEKELVEKHGWTTREELLDIYALSQCTPGVIAVNTSTFMGNKIGKFGGAIAGTIGVVTPSIIIISVIAALLQNFADYPYVIHAMAGVRVAVSALVFSSVIKMIKGAIRSVPQLLIAIISFLLVAVFGTEPAFIVLGAALFGLFFMKGNGKLKMPGKEEKE